MSLVKYFIGMVVVAAVAGCAGAAATTPAKAGVRDDGAVWRPRLATPAIVSEDSARAREFVAEVRGARTASRWRASIANDLRTWRCEVVSAQYATINRETEPGWRVRVRVPADAPPELFTLNLSSSELEASQPNAVSVCRSFNDDFYLLHISDEQIVNEKHTDPSGQYYRMVGTQEEMHWMQEPVNLIHPRLVVITGDQIDYNGALDGWNNWHNWGYEPGGKKHFSVEETQEIEERLSKMYLESHHGYRVPYVEAPGNHDVTPADKKLFGTDVLWHPTSVEFYERFFGQRTWSMRMGDFYVLMHDWTERSLKEWAAKDYEAAGADPSVKYRLIGQHFITDQGFVPERADVMLIGHGHRVVTVQKEPYFIYEDGPAFLYGTTGFFNFRRKDGGGWVCDQTAAGERNVKKDVWRLFGDNGNPKKVRADVPDAMNVSGMSVTITNDLPERFYDGRVRFVLPKGRYGGVENGTVLAQYDSADGTKTAVLVKVDIPASGSMKVSVRQSTR